MLILALKGVRKRYAPTFTVIFYFAIFLCFVFLLEFHSRSKFSTISENTFPDFTLYFLPENLLDTASKCKKQKQQQQQKKKK